MILVGDIHFGVKKFNQGVLENQISYLKDIVLLAKEKNKQIFQLGDVFDNRVNCDINFYNIKYYKINSSCEKKRNFNYEICRCNK